MSREQRIEGPRGKIVVTFPEPWLFVGTISGHYSVDLLGPYVEGMRSALGHGRPMYGFHNWSEMDSYETTCRTTMTDFVMKHRSQMAGQHLLVRSKLVAMGVATAGMLIGGKMLISYNDRTSFDVALRAVLRGKSLE